MEKTLVVYNLPECDVQGPRRYPGLTAYRELRDCPLPSMVPVTARQPSPFNRDLPIEPFHLIPAADPRILDVSCWPFWTRAGLVIRPCCVFL